MEKTKREPTDEEKRLIMYEEAMNDILSERYDKYDGKNKNNEDT